MPFVPAFSDDPLPAARFASLRTFLSRWYDDPLPPAGRVSPDVARLSAELGRPLGVAIREWITLTEDLAAAPRAKEVLRDDRSIANWPEYASLSLNLQAEGDTHWAVPHAHVGDDDPFVHVWWLDYEAAWAKPPLRRFDEIDSHPADHPVSAFAVAYLLSYARGSGWGMRVGDVSAVVGTLRDAGLQVADLGMLQVAEGEGWFTVIERFTGQGQLTYRHRGDTNPVPAVITDMVKRANRR